jgi:cytochrome b6-f complex iron-sulfur subunit
MHGEISRRELLKVAVAAGLTVVGAVGCNSGDDQTASAPGGPGGPGQAAGTPAAKNLDGSATVAGGGNLDNGTAILVTLPDQRPALLFKTKAGEVRALSALCTHNQCTVAWDGGSEKFKCPCHGSVFDASGKPEKGPAKEPLEKYNVQIKGNDAVLLLKS